MNKVTEYLDIKVTKIKNKWHARLINTETDTVLDESACELREDIGHICHDMLRWHDKMGGLSPMADAARHRQKAATRPKGKVWYHIPQTNHKEEDEQVLYISRQLC